MKLLVFLVIFLVGCTHVVPISDNTKKILSEVEYPVSNVHQDKNLVSYYEHKDGLFDTYFVIKYIDENGDIVTFTEEPRFFIDKAEACQLADLTTTAIGIIFFGAVEGNPLGITLIPVKYFSNERFEQMSVQQCKQAKRFSTLFGCGAAATNIATIYQAELNLTGLIFGAVVGSGIYTISEDIQGCEPWAGKKVGEPWRLKIQEWLPIYKFYEFENNSLLGESYG